MLPHCKLRYVTRKKDSIIELREQGYHSVGLGGCAETDAGVPRNLSRRRHYERVN